MEKIFKKINELWLRFKGWSEINILGYIILNTIKTFLIMAVFLILAYLLFTVGPFKDEPLEDSPVSDSGETINENCTVTGIELHGTLLTYIPKHAENDSMIDYDVVASQDIVWTIKQANEDEKIKGIVIEVDSSGGSPVAGEEISNAVKNSDKPVVAFIRQTGASGAYWAISSADKIFASKNSDVGSIGVTSSYLSNAIKNTTDGYTYEQLSAGKYKDAGSADKLLTAEERALFIRDINIVYENFMEDISQNRKIPIDKVKAFSDGSTVLGLKAKELGLVDQIGGIYEVEKYLEETTGEKPEICWQ